MTDTPLSFPRKVANFFWRHKIVTGIILLGAGFFLYRSASQTQAPPQYLLTTVQKNTVVVSVDGTGQVSALNQLDLKPQSSGVVVDLRVKNGDNIQAGQVIAMLDQKNAILSMNQAKVNLAVAESNYQKLLAGASGPDIQQSQVAVTAAEASLENAKRSLEDTKAQQQVSVNNAYHTFLNSGLMNSGVSSVGFSANPSSGNLSTTPPSISGAYIGTEQGDYKINLYDAGQLHFLVTGLETGEGPVNTSSPVPLGTKGLYIQFPTTPLYTSDYWTISIPNTRSSNYLGNLSAYQSALQSQTQAIHNAENSVSNAASSLAQAQAALVLKQAAASPADVASAKAQISLTQLQLQSAQFAYQNNIVTAPFAGQIAQVNVQVGDQASASTAIATLITKQLFSQIPLNEVDVAKVKVGQKVTFSFDAIPDLTLTGTVAEIQTLGTVTQGVVNYNIKIVFDTNDDRVKPGMSAHASIITEAKQDVLTLPNATVKTQGGQSYVEQLNPALTTSLPDNTAITSVTPPTRQVVGVGISNNSVTEIVSGLKEGDRVILQTINPTAKTSATQNQSTGIRIPGLGGFGGGGGGGGARGGGVAAGR